MSTVWGEFFHNPHRDGSPAFCKCRNPKFRHSYGPFSHAHWVGKEDGHYMVCKQDCEATQ